MKNFTYLLFIGLFLSCEEMPKKEIIIDETRSEIKVNKIEDKEPEIVIEKKLPLKENYQCNFGDIEISIEKKYDKLFINSNCKIVDDFTKDINGDLISFIETDVNADGYNEFYCVTNQGDLVAYTSYRNKSFGEIYVTQKPKEFYANIDALESWEVKNSKLHLTLSNKNDDVLNTVRYELIKGETGYKLEAN